MILHILAYIRKMGVNIINNMLKSLIKEGIIKRYDMNNEQWKSGGDWSKCRRQKYCSTMCKENRKLLTRTVYQAVDKKMGGILGKIVNI